MSARQALLDQFAGLSPRLQEAARYVVDHPDAVAVHSMRALAGLAGVRPATLLRLARQVGYAGWPELKAAFIEELGLRAGGYGERARVLAARSDEAGLLRELFEAQRSNLQQTADAGSSLLRAAGRLSKAGRVHVAGFRASFGLASAFHYGYRLFRNSVSLIGETGGGLEMPLRAIEAGDALLVVSFAPYSRESLLVLQSARAAGAAVVAVTDSRAAPLALDADEVLLFATDSPSFFPSLAAGQAVLEGLLAVLVAQSGDAGLRMERAEQSLRVTGAYVEYEPRS